MLSKINGCCMIPLIVHEMSRFGIAILPETVCL